MAGPQPSDSEKYDDPAKYTDEELTRMLDTILKKTE